MKSELTQQTYETQGWQNESCQSCDQYHNLQWASDKYAVCKIADKLFILSEMQF